MVILVKHKRIKNWAKADKLLTDSKNFHYLWFVEKNYDKKVYTFKITNVYAENGIDEKAYLKTNPDFAITHEPLL